MILDKVVVASRNFDIQELIKRIGREVFLADNLNEVTDMCSSVRPELIVCDNSFVPVDIEQLINSIKANSLNIPVIVVTPKDVDFIADGYARLDLLDVLSGPDDYNRLEQIAQSIKNKTNNSQSRQNFFADELAADIGMVGLSKAAVNKIKMIKLVAASNCSPVLVVGETGTGKELAAKAVHNLRHPNESFVAVNCAALTANLLESELFGHVKGAFTGADKEKTGLFELAGNGSIFLDEISEMPLDLQAKLLRVIQERNFRKVGGTATIDCKATIIASSNRNLLKEVQAKRFRSDLYYRLNICPITIAPLRSPERKSDIQLFAEYFLKTSSMCPNKKNKVKSLTRLAVESLEKHDWPGNIRELKNVIDRAIILESTEKIGLSSIVIDSVDEESFDISAANSSKDFSLEKAEKELISKALKETGWQKTQAAALLGITRATLYAKVRQYNIEKDINATKETVLDFIEEFDSQTAATA